MREMAVSKRKQDETAAMCVKALNSMENFVGGKI